MTENPDLAARLLAAIEETERIAQAAGLRHPMPWRVEEPESGTLPSGIWVDDSADQGVVVANGGYIAEYIAHQDPHTVLRRCAADRKILTEHHQVKADRGDHPTGCGTCHYDCDCETVVGEGDCVTIQLLAEGYGIAASIGAAT